MARNSLQRKVITFLVATALTLAVLYLFYHFEITLESLLSGIMVGKAAGKEAGVLTLVKLLLWALLAYLAVRALRVLIFNVAFRLRSGYEAPTLVGNIFSIVAFSALFVLIFGELYPSV